LLIVSRKARTDDQSDRRPRRTVRRLQRHVSAGRHAHAFHEVHRARFPGDAAALREAVREEISARLVSEGDSGNGAPASGSSRRLTPRERGRHAGTGPAVGTRAGGIFVVMRRGAKAPRYVRSTTHDRVRSAQLQLRAPTYATSP